MPPDANGRRLLEYLTVSFRHSDTNTWRTRIDEGELQINGEHASVGAILQRGQEVRWHRPPWEEPDVPTDFAVLFIDEHCLAVAKPSGLPTQPAGGFLVNTLQSRVRRHFPDASPLHRLGRGTSGVVLFARSDTARRTLSEAFRDRKVTKVYRALVTGHPSRDRFTLDVPIGPVPHPALGDVHAACPDGKPAVSHVHVLERRPATSSANGIETTLVEVRIETGRPHQIRIHLAAAGHPLEGDPLYEHGGRPHADCTALPGDTGYRLHARSIGFPHPVLSGDVEVTCPEPACLRAAGSPS